MPTLSSPTPSQAVATHLSLSSPIELYRGLQQTPEQYLAVARNFLQEQLKKAAKLKCDLPDSPEDLHQWVIDGNARTTQAYKQYLDTRKQGQPRRYFANRSQALFFLRGVAPTKLVDGSWLYGVLPQWQDLRLHTLVRTYLEELGEGEPEQNHVVLYKQLLAQHELEDIESLPASHFVQGAQQLALGHLAQDFLPELIGYNLGYEQLPLHLLITTYELNELGIDPYYFQLHVTIDNADTGHAHKAASAVLDNLPVTGNAQMFYRRVRLGYLLNDLALSSTDVINSFCLEQELYRVLEQKALVARNMHSDFCRIEGRTINEWLSQQGQIGDFLAALEKRGWIHRDEDPAQSRFWQLVQGNRAPMFGVFSHYELQLLHDWIAGEWLINDQPNRPKKFVQPGRNQSQDNSARAGDFSAEQQILEKELRTLDGASRTRRLIQLMSPAHHYKPAGLLATRLFNQLQA
ncbi:iron-containing redox enzyme family protein [Halopseudomonas bauzanensis]|uniref:Iron-containing redox enzyme n=1 Tax=Halopseudomonas bauzanensis TaxID=653930 RepID=A0A031MAY4_9GAMM|nr:iron-containing redox enzyme family protein [Halopseudomonas bauzanensis]EZQ17140.1 hypothetical protein CF98_35710 [Halopseudomonas bauzanensis]SES10278.1 Iron-containing redox enzyme [Halopseudomonas bauzanensis]SFM09771.1 Iron-containing redox enzyme [Halopseudomonas bauzanensis]